MLCLAAISAARRKWSKLSKGGMYFFFVCALLGWVLPLLIELTVAKHLSAGLLTLIVSTATLWTVCIAFLGKFARIEPRHIVGILLGLAAAVLLLAPGLTGISSTSVIWVLAAFSVPWCYAAYHNFVAAKWPDDHNSWQVATGEALAGTVMLLPLFVLSRENIANYLHWGEGTWPIPFMVLFGLVEIYLYFEIVRLAGPVTVSQANYVAVVAGVIWGMVIFGEPFMPVLWLAGLLLVTSLYLTREKRRVMPG